MFSVSSIIQKFIATPAVTPVTMYSFSASALTPDNSDKLVGLRVQAYSVIRGMQEGVVTSVDFIPSKWGVYCEVSVDVNISGSFVRTEAMPMIFAASDIKTYWE